MPIKEVRRRGKRIYIVVNRDGTKMHGSHATLATAETQDRELHGRVEKSDKLIDLEKKQEAEGRVPKTEAAKQIIENRKLKQQLKDLQEGKEIDVDIDAIVRSRILEMDKG